MKQRRSLNIRNKIFKKEDIEKIWKMVNQEFISSLSEENNTKVLFTTSCDTVDGRRYESESENILQNEDVVDVKKISTISIEYRDPPRKRGIVILLNSLERIGSKLTVYGASDDWVAGAFDRINSVLDSASPQGHWIIKWIDVFTLIGGTLFGMSFLKLTEKLISENIQAPRILLLIYIPFGWLVCHLCGLWLLQLWPSIEFDFGPEHLKFQKNRRKRLLAFFSLWLAPLVVSLIYDYLRKLWGSP